MKIKYWNCPKCQSTVYGRYRVFKCNRCGYEPPINDYKKAFYDLKNEFDDYKEESMNGLSAILRSSDLIRQKLKMFQCTALVLAILCIFLCFN